MSTKYYYYNLHDCHLSLQYLHTLQKICQVIDQNVPVEHSFVVIRFFNEDKVLRIDFGQDWKDLGFHVAQLPPKMVKSRLITPNRYLFARK